MDYPGKVITKNQVTPTQISATGVWTLDDAAAATRNNNWPVAGVPNPISKSLRFNSADSAYLNRTPASAGNRKTWTWSGWVKRSALGAIQFIFGAYDNSSASNSTYTGIGFGSTDTLSVAGWSAAWRTTTQVFRDTSAWYHIVVALDTTQATANNRVKVYVNGVEITAFATTNNPTQNDDLGINATNQHRLGSINYSSPYYFSGYMTEVNFIDGQALTPSSFGMTDPVTGVWEPLKYTGTYGTNGFYLNFKDSSSTTALGLDYSGNANNWTTNNFSVTAGSGNDSLTDVPTPWVAYNTTGDVGGVVRGNYATLNPLDATGTLTVSNGNLQVTASSDVNTFTVRGTVGVSSGSWYWECVKLVSGDTGAAFGIMNVSQAISGAPTGCYGIRDDGNKVVNGTYSAFGSSFTTAVVGLAFNATSGTLEIFLNNVSQGTISSIPAGTYAPYISDTSTGAGTNAGGIINFGQRPFAYTPPSGFLSLCTTNLPASTVLKGSEYFNTVLYTGNGSATNTVTTNFGFTPDLIWNKNRTAVASHALQSSPVSYRYLSSDSTAAEGTAQIGSVGDNSYLIGSSNSIWNASGNTYVSWLWKANGAGVTNTAGSITSTVSANTTSGFSIVTYTGNGIAGATVGHGLGVAPRMFILKSRSATTNWDVYHASLGNTGGIYLNSTSAFVSNTLFWNDTSPTSSVLTLGGGSDINTNGQTGVIYCFAAISGFSAFGSYTGNASTDGPFIYLGFRPRYVMVKRTDASNEWLIHDSARSTYNVVNARLSAQSSSAESTSPDALDFISNGFKLRTTDTGWNASGGTYIYMAFAENPFKNALAR